MARFIKKIFILVLCLIISIAAFVSFDFFVVGNQYSELYQASINDKMARLRSIEGPKIILVGNSNISFGFNSALLEEAMGLPVVNLGLHGSLDNAFHEEMAKQNIGKGDIVIVCHSNYSDTDNIPDSSLAWVSIEKHTELWPILRLKDYPEMLKAYPRYALEAFLLWMKGEGNIKTENTCYSRDAFNEYGDIVYRPEKEAVNKDELFAKDTMSVPKISEECIERLNEYKVFIEERGATMLVAGYPIGYGEFTPPAEEYLAFQRQLEEQLDCIVISDYTDYFIPYEYFFNTNLHLTQEGADIRTRQLIEDLQNWQATEYRKVYQVD